MPDDLETAQDIAFEAVPAASALAQLGSDRAGLSETEAAKRLAQHGPNVLPPAVSRSSFARFIDQFRSVLIYVLIGAAVVTAQKKGEKKGEKKGKKKR